LPIEGHVFAEIYDAESRKWIKVNPPSEQTNDFELLIRREFRRYVEAGAGVDFGSIYVKKNGVYLPEARRVQSIDEIMKVAEEIGESK